MSELKKELLRKSIHFSGIVYIPAYLYFGKELVTIGVALTLLFALIFEFFRLKYNLLSGIVREHEKERIGAYIYFGVAILFITLLFPMDAAFSAVLVTLLGDGLGGIVKRLPIKRAKNVATIVMVVVPFVASLPLLSPLPSFMACVSGAIVERVEKVGDYYLQDNLTVPVTAALVYHSVNYILP
ncbi:diacylglycerol/polyprenol kinase family protein [Archaeoglobus sp.]